MITKEIESFTRNQVCCLLEVTDLLRNRYIEMFCSISKDLWVWKLRKLTGDRTLMVTWKPDFYEIREGKKVLKRYPD